MTRTSAVPISLLRPVMLAGLALLSALGPERPLATQVAAAAQAPVAGADADAAFGGLHWRHIGPH
nr:hypothetical protein [Acidobacteriota bacterium]